MMTIRAAKFTPEVLLSAPRRSAGSPNSSGKLVLYTVSLVEPPCLIRRVSQFGIDCIQVSTYSFRDHRKTSEIQVLDLESGQATTLYKDSKYSEPTWISESEFVLVKSGEKGTSSLVLADVTSPGTTSVLYLLAPVPRLPPTDIEIQSYGDQQIQRGHLKHQAEETVG